MLSTFRLLPFLTQPPSFHSLFRYRFTLTSGVYKRLGEFDYGQPSCTTGHLTTCFGKDSYSCIYIGEVKEGTDHTPHGIGIQVERDGESIREGYWKDGQLHGRGRLIFYYGDYYIGEWKEGDYNGEGVKYWADGDRYEGEWENNKSYGQGIYYTKNGDKYTGIWVSDWEGQGEINYKDGTKYKGHWDGFKRHGLGTLYSADGQVLNQGKWEWDEYQGKE